MKWHYLALRPAADPFLIQVECSPTQLGENLREDSRQCGPCLNRWKEKLAEETSNKKRATHFHVVK